MGWMLAAGTSWESLIGHATAGAAVARQPGSSNRDIGAAAGMSDQSQISKLLNRLEGFGLIANVGEGQVKGAPNAWHLTERGEQLERSLRG